LPDEVSNKLKNDKENYYKDYFLFEAAFVSSSKIIVTTDIRLINHMRESDHYILIQLDDFLKQYCN
jgi:predicted nucleic acid-binding protein